MTMCVNRDPSRCILRKELIEQTYINERKNLVAPSAQFLFPESNHRNIVKVETLDLGTI
mgnify:CR=1 FL=1